MIFKSIDGKASKKDKKHWLKEHYQWYINDKIKVNNFEKHTKEKSEQT